MSICSDKAWSQIRTLGSLAASPGDLVFLDSHDDLLDLLARHLEHRNPVSQREGNARAVRGGREVARHRIHKA